MPEQTSNIMFGIFLCYLVCAAKLRLILLSICYELMKPNRTPWTPTCKQ